MTRCFGSGQPPPGVLREREDWICVVLHAPLAHSQHSNAIILQLTRPWSRRGRACHRNTWHTLGYGLATCVSVRLELLEQMRGGKALHGQQRILNDELFAMLGYYPAHRIARFERRVPRGTSEQRCPSWDIGMQCRRRRSGTRRSAGGRSDRTSSKRRERDDHVA